MQIVGQIDAEIYQCVVSEILTADVVMTDERIEHIRMRHPQDYERFCKYIPQMIAEPDYIVEANKEHTAVLLKAFEEDGEKFKLILRLRVKSDPEGYVNSVLSFWYIGDTTWNKTIKNKKILYKRE